MAAVVAGGAVAACSPQSSSRVATIVNPASTLTPGSRLYRSRSNPCGPVQRSSGQRPIRADFDDGSFVAAAEPDAR